MATITSLKFKNAPSWPPEELTKMKDLGRNVFELKSESDTTTYSFSDDFKKCQIVNVGNTPKLFKKKCELNVEVDFITKE